MNSWHQDERFRHYQPSERRPNYFNPHEQHHGQFSQSYYSRQPQQYPRHSSNSYYPSDQFGSSSSSNSSGYQHYERRQHQPHPNNYPRPPANTKTGMMQSFRPNELKRWLEEYLLPEHKTGPIESTEEVINRLVKVFEYIGPPTRMAMKGYNRDNGKFYGTLMNFVMAYDYEMMNAKLPDFCKFLQQLTFPRPTWDPQSNSYMPARRPLTDHETIFDYLRSTDFEKAVIHASRLDPNFIGNRSPYYSEKIQHEKNEEAQKAAAAAAAGGATDEDAGDDSDSTTKQSAKKRKQVSKSKPAALVPSTPAQSDLGELLQQMASMQKHLEKLQNNQNKQNTNPAVVVDGDDMSGSPAQHTRSRHQSPKKPKT